MRKRRSEALIGGGAEGGVAELPRVGARLPARNQEHDRDREQDPEQGPGAGAGR